MLKHAKGHSDAASRRYWADREHMYPHQIEVEHMSGFDLNPRLFAREVSMDFLRVPFDGIAHWGFRYEQTLEKFKQMIGR
jgi:hypothetical protein